MRLWETPVPMPNTTVKTQAADDTWLETARESKWLPELNKSIIPGCSVAWLARLIWDQEVAGSNPVTPILIYARVAQWWSIALPRRGSRVRIPSRAFLLAGIS